MSLIVAEQLSAVDVVGVPRAPPESAIVAGLAAPAGALLGISAAGTLPAATIAGICVAVPILLSANEDRLPRWIGTGAAIFTVEQLIETITIIGPPGSFISPGGPMNHYLGGTLTAAFFLALGIALSQHGDQSIEPAPSAETGTTAEPGTAEEPAESGPADAAATEPEAATEPVGER